MTWNAMPLMLHHCIVINTIPRINFVGGKICHAPQLYLVLSLPSMETIRAVSLVKNNVVVERGTRGWPVSDYPIVVCFSFRKQIPIRCWILVVPRIFYKVVRNTSIHWGLRKWWPLAAEIFKCLFLNDHHQILYDFWVARIPINNESALVQDMIRHLSLVSISTCSVRIYLFSSFYFPIVVHSFYNTWRERNDPNELKKSIYCGHWATTLLGRLLKIYIHKKQISLNTLGWDLRK